MDTKQEKPRRPPDPARVFGWAELDRLMAGDTSKIRRAIKFVKWQLSRGVGVQAYHDMEALESMLNAEISRRSLIAE